MNAQHDSTQGEEASLCNLWSPYALPLNSVSLTDGWSDTGHWTNTNGAREVFLITVFLNKPLNGPTADGILQRDNYRQEILLPAVY